MYSATTANEETLHQHILYACKTICDCSQTFERVLQTMIRCVHVHTDSGGGLLSICGLIWNTYCKYIMSVGSKKHYIVNAFIVCNLSIKLKKPLIYGHMPILTFSLCQCEEHIS